MRRIVDNLVVNAIEHAPYGSTVTVRGPDGKRHAYQLVGPAEAAPGDGRISHESPVGRALLGKKRGDKVQVNTPKGVMEMAVVAVS